MLQDANVVGEVGSSRIMHLYGKIVKVGCARVLEVAVVFLAGV